VARGGLIDQRGGVAALESGRRGAAVPDAPAPEPLPPDDPLWRAPNAIVTSHMAGQAQTDSMERAVERFLKNLDHYLKGEPLEYVVDLRQGY